MGRQGPLDDGPRPCWFQGGDGRGLLAGLRPRLPL